LRDRTATRDVAPRRTRAGTVVVLAVALLAAACSGDQSALDPAGPYAQEPHDLIQIVFLIALVVFVLVQGLIIYSVVKFRTRKDDDGSLPVQVHGNTRLEIFWTIIPALILAAIAVPTVQGIFSQMAEPDDPDTLTVEVVGHRWWWEFYYPDWDIYTANELVIPVDVPVRLEMTAADPGRSPERGVIHSFWLPRLAGKQDVVPGQVTFLNIRAAEPGYYYGQCAEYCGLSHVNMRNRARALEGDEFQAWVDNQTSPANAPEEGSLEAEGAELFGALGDGRQSCVACHAIWDGEGTRAAGVGPDLTHFMTRDEFAGAIVDNNEENLRAWLENPNAVKPMQAETGIGMPNLNLTDEEIDALVAYLMSLD
jgi:cytochrome c oxidase subunit II